MQMVLVFIVLCLPLSATAAIYKSVDKNGDVNFSDQPASHATVVNLPKAQTYQSLVSTTAKDKSINKIAQKIIPSLDYTQLTLQKPANNSTVWLGSNSSILVQADLKPGLQAGDTAQLLLDDKIVQSFDGPQTSLRFALKEYTLGKHSVAVQILRAEKVLKTSNTIGFFVLLHRNDQN